MATLHGSQGTNHQPADPVIKRLFSALAVFIGLLIECTPIAVAQQPPMPHQIGVLQAGSWTKDFMSEFRQGFRDAGYVEGRDIQFHWRRVHGDYDQLAHSAADLVQNKVEVIVAADTPSALAAKSTGGSTPVVMVHISDPIGAGLVQSLAHPGGNVTGLTIMTPDISAKRLQLVREMLPKTSRLGILRDPGMPSHARLVAELEAAAPALGFQPTLVAVSRRDQFKQAFARLRRAHVQVLYVVDDAFFASSMATILDMARQSQLPVIYASREYVANGALMFYGVDHADQCRRVASYVDKILKGTKPADLPIEQPTRFVLVVNEKAAKSLGITIPGTILQRADEVIR